MEDGRPCKRPRFDLNEAANDDTWSPKILRLTPGKHIIRGSPSKVANHIEELVYSSNVRMHTLFGGDDNSSVRRFAQSFGCANGSGGVDIGVSGSFEVRCIGIDPGNRLDGCLMGAVNVKHGFDLNSLPGFHDLGDSVGDDGIGVGSTVEVGSRSVDSPIRFEGCQVDVVNVKNGLDLNSLPGDGGIGVRSTFEVGSSSGCQRQAHVYKHADGIVVSDLDDIEEDLFDDNELCKDDDLEAFDEGEPCLEMTSLDSHGARYSDLGDCDYSCQYCGARFWYKEKVNPKKRSRVPVYSLCCSKGKVKLSILAQPPEYLLRLFFDETDPVSKHFQKYIRAFNTMFSFTSMGGKVDNTVNDGRGRYIYRISGQNHHRMGSLLPCEGQPPKFSQLYIYDTENEVSNRLAIGRSSSSGVEADYDYSIVQGLKEMIDQYNPIAKAFRMTRDSLQSQPVSNMKLKLIRKRSKDSRLYNMPTVDEVAALIPGDMDINNVERDIIVETRDGRLQRIHELHPLYVPMHYPVFFPHGESTRPDAKRKGKITLREFWSFRFQERDEENAIYLYGRKLFQQLVVDAYTMVESWRLTYYRAHQKNLRQSVYKGLVDAVYQGEREGCAIGKRIVLPSSFTGGARYMMQNYQDAMSICRWAGYPDVFIIFTCNPKWPEITRHVKKKGLKAEDRPDIVARVFRMKLREFIDDLKSGKVFDKVKAVVYTIEFQKRGLPHAHILLFLQPQCKYPNPEVIDKIISAEIPDPNQNPELYEAVNEFMMHGPCGNCDRKAPCMVDGRCSKHYPKDWAETTTINDDGYPVYRRRRTSIRIEKNGIMLDNRSTVPFNAYLLMKYRSHINVEWCNQQRSIKYLFKYVCKGSDRVTAALYKQSSGEPGAEVDEIQCCYDCRYVSPCEAMWRIYSFEINYRQPAVERLKYHLPGEQSVVFEDEDNIAEVIHRPNNQTSMFLAWFQANQEYEEAKNLTYDEFPTKFVFKRREMEWRPRKKGLTIGRLIYVPPSSGELFYLSMLLHRVKGPQCYEDVRTVHGVVQPTFREACYKLGLLEDDREFIEAIKEAAD